MIRSSKKSSDRKRMISELDQLVRKLVMERDNNECVRCGKKILLAAAHIFPKGKYPRLRFELLNVLSLCYYDHMEFGHKDPVGFTQWLEGKYPGRIETLREMSSTAAKLDLKELLIALRLEVKALDDLPPGRVLPKDWDDDSLPF